MLPRVNLIRTDETDYLMLSTGDAISTTIYKNGYWAKLLIDIGLSFCAGLEAPLVIDIGANLGAYAVPMAQKIAPAGGLVYAYEPQRIVYYQLCGNAFLNRLENLHAFNMAFGSADGSVQIPNIDYTASANVGGFTLDEQAKANLVGFTEKGGSSAVALRTLDTLDVPKAPALVKIDVEGLELDVLQGAGRFLDDHGHPPLILEAWTLDWFAARRTQLLDHIRTLGYDYFLIGDEIIAQHPNYARSFQFSVGADSLLQMIRTR